MQVLGKFVGDPHHQLVGDLILRQELVREDRDATDYLISEEIHCESIHETCLRSTPEVTFGRHWWEYEVFMRHPINGGDGFAATGDRLLRLYQTHATMWVVGAWGDVIPSSRLYKSGPKKDNKK